MLEVEELHAYYGKSHILQGVTFHVRPGEIVSLLGRNGAGRSTTIKTIMGEVRPAGAIRFKGARIDGLKPHEIARRGLGYVPENRDIFPALTVRENLLLGMKGPRASGRCRARTSVCVSRRSWSELCRTSGYWRCWAASSASPTGC